MYFWLECAGNAITTTPTHRATLWMEVSPGTQILFFKVGSSHVQNILLWSASMVIKVRSVFRQIS